MSTETARDRLARAERYARRDCLHAATLVTFDAQCAIVEGALIDFKRALLAAARAEVEALPQVYTNFADAMKGSGPLVVRVSDVRAALDRLEGES